MDIGSSNGYPASALSNFAGHRFVIDGVQCNSMEGFLQSLKFIKPEIQREVCKLVGIAAKRRGRGRSVAWRKTQTLYWNGEPYLRRSEEYTALITRAYDAMYEQSTSFRAALYAAQDATFTHSIGHGDKSATVLTEAEFCRQLRRLQQRFDEEHRTVTRNWSTL